jgi:hypothetical protein
MPRSASLEPEAREERRVRDAYGASLFFVLVSTLILIAAGAPLPSSVVAFGAVLQIGALLLTLRVSGFSARLRAILTAVMACAFLAGPAAIMLGGETGLYFGLSLWMMLVLTTIVAVLKRLWTYKRITVQLVMGLLVVYILIGVLFGLGYTSVEVANPDAFAQGHQGVSGAMYFSFVTLATLGYGDVSPRADLMRALAVAEAIIGQLYLVSVVSVAVSRLGLVRRDASAEENE